MNRHFLNNAIAWYLAEPRKRGRRCSLEGDWKASLYDLIDMPSNELGGELSGHISEKSTFYYIGSFVITCSLYNLVWNSALKPTAPPNDIEIEDASETIIPRLQTALPTFIPDDATATAAAFSRHIPSLPPSTSSIAPTTSSEASNTYHIQILKPDITVGLAHTGFKPGQQRSLVDHQASGSILGDPHAAEMGIRFPFLVVEVKGLSLNGSLVSAQNQAAISGAAVLAILQDLRNQADGFIATHENPAVCFSIVTMGPIHDLGVHFMHNGAPHMHCFRTCRTTLQRDTTEFVSFLIRILKWGKGEFKTAIVEKLDHVPRALG
jgi:hypothetical protein